MVLSLRHVSEQRVLPPFAIMRLSGHSKAVTGAKARYHGAASVSGGHSWQFGKNSRGEPRQRTPPRLSTVPGSQAASGKRAPPSVPGAETTNHCGKTELVRSCQDAPVLPRRQTVASSWRAHGRRRRVFFAAPVAPSCFFSEFARKPLESHDSRVDKGRDFGAERMLNDAERRPNGRRTMLNGGRTRAESKL